MVKFLFFSVLIGEGIKVSLSVLEKIGNDSRDKKFIETLRILGIYTAFSLCKRFKICCKPLRK